MDLSNNLFSQLAENISTVSNDVSINIDSTIGAIGPFALWILGIIGFWLCLNKLGDGGWKAIIPIYSTYTMFKHAFKSVIWFILYFIGNISVYASVFGLCFGAFGLIANSLSNGDSSSFNEETNILIFILSLCVFFFVGIFVSILKKVAIFKFMGKIDGSYICSIIGIFLPQVVMFFLGVANIDFNKANQQRKNQYDNNGFVKMDTTEDFYDYGNYGGDDNEKKY